MMSTLFDLGHYFSTVWANWFGIVGVILTALEIIRTAANKPLPISPTIYRVCLVALIVVAQFVAYQDIEEQKRKAEDSQSATADQNRNLQNENNKLKTQIANLPPGMTDLQKDVAALRSENASLKRINETQAAQIKSEAEETQKVSRIKEQIGKYMEDGIRRVVYCQNPSGNQGYRDFTAWDVRVRDYLQLALGTATAERFADGTGLTQASNSQIQTLTLMDQTICTQLQFRVVRLSQIIAALK